MAVSEAVDTSHGLKWASKSKPGMTEHMRRTRAAVSSVNLINAIARPISSRRDCDSATSVLPSSASTMLSAIDSWASGSSLAKWSDRRSTSSAQQVRCRRRVITVTIRRSGSS